VARCANRAPSHLSIRPTKSWSRPNGEHTGAHADEPPTADPESLDDPPMPNFLRNAGMKQVADQKAEHRYTGEKKLAMSETCHHHHCPSTALMSISAYEPRRRPAVSSPIYSAHRRTRHDGTRINRYAGYRPQSDRTVRGTSVDKQSGDSDDLTVGDEMTVRIRGPWDGPVRVVNRTETSFRFATLNNHMEAGQSSSGPDHKTRHYTLKSKPGPARATRSSISCIHTCG
jgi:hypothetical protein